MITIILLELVIVIKRLLKTILSIFTLVYNVQVLCGDDGYGIFNPPTIDEKTNYDYDMPPLFDNYGDENNDSYLVEFAPITITRNDYDYMRSNYFMHVAHDKNVLCDDY